MNQTLTGARVEKAFAAQHRDRDPPPSASPKNKNAKGSLIHQNPLNHFFSTMMLSTPLSTPDSFLAPFIDLSLFPPKTRPGCPTHSAKTAQMTSLIVTRQLHEASFLPGEGSDDQMHRDLHSLQSDK